MTTSPPVFGKRTTGTSSPLTTVAATPAGASIDQAAFFAAVRAEVTESNADASPIVVPLSFKAAFLAGLVVGCGLIGFDLTGSEAGTSFTGLTSALGLHVEIGGSLVPAMMLLGLLGGARTAALNLTLVHACLRRMRQTSLVAYALGGAAAAATLAAALLLLAGHEPAHGWAVDLLAGGAGGLLYRVFAGTRSA